MTLAILLYIYLAKIHNKKLTEEKEGNKTLGLHYKAFFYKTRFKQMSSQLCSDNGMKKKLKCRTKASSPVQRYSESSHLLEIFIYLIDTPSSSVKISV